MDSMRFITLSILQYELLCLYRSWRGLRLTQEQNSASSHEQQNSAFAVSRKQRSSIISGQRTCPLGVVDLPNQLKSRARVERSGIAAQVGLFQSKNEQDLLPQLKNPGSRSPESAHSVAHLGIKDKRDDKAQQLSELVTRFRSGMR